MFSTAAVDRRSIGDHVSSAVGAQSDITTEDLPSTEEILVMYRSMATITVANDRITGEVSAGRLQATFYPVRGLEGVCAALGACLRSSDGLVSTYRNLGDAVAKGVPLRAVIAELYGRVGGTSKGKGGPMHLQDASAGLVLTTGIVGSGLPIAVGLALAAQLDGEDRVVAVTFGDGATSIGSYHEAMNLASLWNLPIVFVCQNNMWAEHTPIVEYAPSIDLAKRASSYAMRSCSVDGFDVISTWRALRAAVTETRAGRGPSFVECQTYRLAGHTSATDYSYMPEDDFQAALRQDPAPSFRRWLDDRKIADEATLADIDRQAVETVDEAFEFALGSPAPDLAQQDQNVFAAEPEERS
jgi:pyruvate dehydrogenase E1 component alpha subunit